MTRFAAIVALLILAACSRENRETKAPNAEGESLEIISQTPLSPGASAPARQVSGLGDHYQANAYHASQGKKWYSAFNCVGCHSQGGGGSGPPLMDDRWIYGGEIENIVATIREGRPNGMPSFRDKITDEQIWQLATYVRSMSGNLSSDVAPGRNDDLGPHEPENMMQPQQPVQSGPGQ